MSLAELHLVELVDAGRRRASARPPWTTPTPRPGQLHRAFSVLLVDADGRIAAAAAGRGARPGSRCAGPTPAAATRARASRGRGGRRAPAGRGARRAGDGADRGRACTSTRPPTRPPGGSSTSTTTCCAPLPPRTPRSPRTRPRSPTCDWIAADDLAHRPGAEPQRRRGWPGVVDRLLAPAPPGSPHRQTAGWTVAYWRRGGGPPAGRRGDHAADLAPALRHRPQSARAGPPPPVHRRGHRTPGSDAAPDRRGLAPSEAARWARESPPVLVGDLSPRHSPCTRRRPRRRPAHLPVGAPDPARAGCPGAMR